MLDYLEPIAIIGIGCRFPGGANSPDSFWELLKDGRDGIADVPADRWNADQFYDADPAAPGKMYVRAGGFLQQRIDEFDAHFFGMSPREAGFIDPQQRLLLEVAWEALEDAGLAPEALAGSDTGVYVGGFMLDNLLTQFSPLNRDAIGSYSAVGSTLTILSNRLSYVFDLRGPSMTIDTACSSSLVAMHEACQAIWRGECALVLCGGVNVMHRPENLIAMCKGGFLSPDGRSKSFDSRANGYGRGEGAGIVVLKPYAAAVRDGDDIYGLVRGTGANQDGRTDGITVPNPAAQEALIRKVWAAAGVAPRQVRYVEAHGTGTPVGDPLEASAIGAVVGPDRAADAPCLISSVKANIGHLEAASGIAGVIKLALCLKHRAIPPLANLQQPNPAIPFAELGLRLPLALEPMPAGDGPAYVAINSFGYGGTNAHAILQEVTADPRADALAPTPDASPRWQVLPLSARSPAALQALAAAYQKRLAAPDAPALADLCRSAALRRGHLEQRLALAADTREGMVAQLATWLAEGAGSGIAAGTPTVKGQRPVFVCTGMGPQWWAMGRELFHTEPVFRAFAERCDTLFKGIAGWSILAEMLADEADSRLRETQIAQPANFVLQAGLATLWRAWGVAPAAVVGHSVGEVTSAYLAGVLSLEDALQVSYHRSRIQKQAAGIGTMLAVGLSAADVAPYLEQAGGAVSLAAANAPTAVTLAGDTDALAAIAADLKERGVFNRFLTVEVAYHSPTMEPLKPEMREVLADLRLQPAALPLYSTVRGDLARLGDFDAEYWCNNIREPVYFEKAMDALLRDGHRLFLEIGPHPVLSSSIKEILASRGVTGVLLASLRRGKPELPTLAEALAGLYVAGAAIDWSCFHGGPGRYVKLPGYPWQREHHWHESEAAFEDRLGRAEHPLLGRAVDGPAIVWESTLNRYHLPYLPDHCVQDLVILPGAAYVELGLALHRRHHGEAVPVLEDLEFHKALIVPAAQQPRLHVRYDAATRHYSVFSREKEGAAWTPHARGRLSFLAPARPAVLDLAAIRGRCPVAVSGADHYADMHARGLQYGPWFQGVQELAMSADGTEILATIAGPGPLAADSQSHLLHPSLLDACFQSLLAGLTARNDRNVYVPTQIREVVLHASPVGRFWCHSTITRHQGSQLEGHVVLVDEAGAVLAEVRGVRAQALSNRSQDNVAELDQWLYQFAWEAQPPVEVAADAATGRWLVFADHGGTAAELCVNLQRRGAETLIKVYPGTSYWQEDAYQYCVRPEEPADFTRLLDEVDAGRVRGILYCWGLDLGETGMADDPTGTGNTVAALHLVQAVAARLPGPVPRVAFVTRLAQPIEPDQAEVAIAQAPLVGFVRVAINEFSEIPLRAIDLDHSVDTTLQLALEVLSDSREEEVALRQHGRFASRLVRRDGRTLAAGNVEAQLAALAGRHPPAGDEVVVALGQAALPASGTSGAIACGVTVDRGPLAAEMPLGEPMLVRLDGHAGDFVTAPAAAVTPAGALTGHPVPPLQLLHFVAAAHAVCQVARLGAGERVLIHDGASPFGLAAIQFARLRGATVFTTAADPAQRAQLTAWGLAGVFDAGSMALVDGITAQTGPHKLDVVIGSAGGELAGKSLALLGPSGRFVHVGSGFLPPAAGGGFLLPTANQTVVGADLFALQQSAPERFGELVAEVVERLVRSELTPLPEQRIPAVLQGELEADRGAPGTLVMLDFGDAGANAALARQRAARFRADASYLITGGFGGFGLELAKWLVTQGARHLVLVGRSGAASPAAQEAVARLQAAGATVLPVAANIAEEADVRRLLAEAAAQLPPLRGIFHAAAVLDDGVIKTLDAAKFAAVMRPKALGAWLLHQQTAGLPLDHFVSFSSVGSLVGNPGQGTYVAANNYLDVLAHHRRARQQPATTINWGALAEVGMAAREAGVGDYLNRMGFGSFTPGQALKVLDRILDWKPITVGATRMNWQSLKNAYPAWADSPRFSVVMAETAVAGATGGAAGPLQTFAALPVEARPDAVAAALVELVASTLRLPVQKVDLGQSLLNIGMDSLLAIEIQAAIERGIGVKVSTLELMKGNSLQQLVEHCVATIAAGAVPTATVATPALPAAPATPVPPATASPPAADLANLRIEHLQTLLDSLSDADIDAALARLSAEETTA